MSKREFDFEVDLNVHCKRLEGKNIVYNVIIDYMLEPEFPVCIKWVRLTEDLSYKINYRVPKLHN